MKKGETPNYGGWFIPMRLQKYTIPQDSSLAWHRKEATAVNVWR